MMSCFCDYDPAEFYHAQRRKARKPHKCDECRRAIQPGETYEHARGKWEGDVGTFDTCCRCLALRDFVQAHVPCFCWAHGNMIEDATETADEYAHETVGLKFGALRREVLIYRGQKYGEGA